MELALKGLLVDKQGSSVEELEECLKPDLHFEYCNQVNSVHKALEKYMEGEYNVCFISSTFPEEEVREFIKDYEKVKKEMPCVFIQLRDTLSLEFDRSSVERIGFATVVSKIGDHRDKDALWEALKPLIELLEKQSTQADVTRAVDSLMGDIDKVAKQRKRGAKAKLSTIYSGFVDDETTKNPELLEEYFETLVETAEEAKPFTAVKIEVPENILKKNLPNLEKDKYTGASHRVWDKLLDLHGIEEGATKKLTRRGKTQEIVPLTNLEKSDPEKVDEES